jgi:hypothetical protein
LPYFPTRKTTIFAQDPSIRLDGKIVRAQIEIPNEALQPGPRGYRVQVVDYDSSTHTLYKTMPHPSNRADGLPDDPFCEMTDDALLASPDFHAMNTYAIIMRTLAHFEFALGRRVAWSFPGHQIQVAPHAFADANAFYSPEDQALMFGYFPRHAGRGRVFACLAHDVIAHETTHALLDGLRERYTDPSSPQQAGFHEGFADIVALLSLFSLRDVVGKVLDPARHGDRISAEAVSPKALRQSILMGVAEQFGQELSGVRGNALRRSVTLEPGQDYLSDAEFEEPHRLGEVLVAAIMNAFLNVWEARLAPYFRESKSVDRQRAVEEGADVADRLLTICIRALDYCPPTDLQFGDFASALLTADWEMYPRDSKYGFRDALRASFRDYGIHPTSKGKREPGAWDPPPAGKQPVYDRTHFEAMQRDPDELFRFVWENRKVFNLCEDAYTRVLSVRPCLRIGYDGFALRETIVEYLQLLTLRAEELKPLNIRQPGGMPNQQEVTLYGGNAMIFDQFGLLKYNIGNSIFNAKRQSERLSYLWQSGDFAPGASKLRRFAAMHRRRMTSWSQLNSAGAAVDWTAVSAREPETVEEVL